MHYRYIDWDDLQTELKTVNQKLVKITAKKHLGFTGVAFIVFNSPQDALEVLKKTQSNNYLTRIFEKIQSHKITWERAPEPSDIFWENLGQTFMTRFKKLVKSIVHTLLVLLVGYILLLPFENINNDLEDAIDDNKEKEEPVLWARTGSYITIFILTIIKELQSGRMTKISMSEGHETQTMVQISEAIKLTILKFLNDSFILMSLHSSSDDWFEEDGLISEVLILIVIMTFEVPIKALINKKKISKMVTLM